MQTFSVILKNKPEEFIQALYYTIEYDTGDLHFYDEDDILLKIYDTYDWISVAEDKGF